MVDWFFLLFVTSFEMVENLRSPCQYCLTLYLSYFIAIVTITILIVCIVKIQIVPILSEAIFYFLFLPVHSVPSYSATGYGPRITKPQPGIYLESPRIGFRVETAFDFGLKKHNLTLAHDGE